MYKHDTIFIQPMPTIITNSKLKFFHNLGFVDAGNKQTMHNKETDLT